MKKILFIPLILIVTCCKKPHACFSLSPQNPSFGEKITIDPSCTQDAKSWYYIVDGESIGGSEEFIGDAAGEYVVTLKACSGKDGGGSSDEFSQSIFVSDKVGFICNSPVNYDETITITAKVDRNATYDWKGPNNFVSDQKSITIPHANAGAAGIYSLVATINGNSSATSTVNVEVTTVNPQCNLGNNECTLTGGYSGGPANVISYVNMGNYEMSIGSGGHTITLRFNKPASPFAGMYEVTQNSFTINDGQVNMDINLAGSMQNTIVGNGKVFISVNAGKVTAVFCDIPFTYMTGSYTISGNVTEP
jgi:hypothetical protein